MRQRVFPGSPAAQPLPGPAIRRFFLILP